MQKELFLSEGQTFQTSFVGELTNDRAQRPMKINCEKVTHGQGGIWRNAMNES
jgi:hypothetical protein